MGRGRAAVHDFDGDVALLKADSDWLGSEDIFGHEPKVTIKRVLLYENAKVAGRTIPKFLALEFEGKHKKLIVNATNRRRLWMTLGTKKAAEWVGRTVTLCCEKCKAPPGMDVDETYGVRIKLPPKLAPAPEPHHRSEPPQPTVVYEREPGADDEPPDDFPPTVDFGTRTDDDPTEPPADWQGGVQP